MEKMIETVCRKWLIDLLKLPLETEAGFVTGATMANFTGLAPEIIYVELSNIVTAINKGSVITKDAGVTLLANLSTVENQQQEVFPLLLKELTICPAKQLSQYAAKSLIAVNKKNKTEFSKLINLRIADLEKDSQIKRINKVLRDVEKI